jgi:hypothetical protein
MTVVLLPGALIVWACCAIAAIRDNKRLETGKVLDRHAQMIGQQVAANLKQGQS